MMTEADDYLALASKLREAAVAQVEALGSADTAAFSRALNQFDALSVRWEAAAVRVAALTAAEQVQIGEQLQAAAAALARAEQIGREQRDELAQQLGAAPLQRERILAYSRTMQSVNS